MTQRRPGKQPERHLNRTHWFGSPGC